jgi:hypothetical protein
MATKTIGQLTQATTINNADEFAIEQSGVTKRVAASVVRGDIANANIKSDAAIAYSKLAALNSAQILVGNGSNVPTAVSVTGDVTISNAGVTAIGSAKVLPAMLSQPYTLATAQNSTSGTSIDFTGIPSWVKRITVMISGLSASGTSPHLLRVGTSSGFVTSGYTSGVSVYGGSNIVNSANNTNGFNFSPTPAAASVACGALTLLSVSGNTWVHTSVVGFTDAAFAATGGGNIALGGTLDRVRITTVNGTDTFDAGSINISYEG